MIKIITFETILIPVIIIIEFNFFGWKIPLSMVIIIIELKMLNLVKIIITFLQSPVIIIIKFEKMLSPMIIKFHCIVDERKML